LSTARAVVTGGFGFVGPQLCRALVNRGVSVTVLDDLSVGSALNLETSVAGAVDSVEADVRDLDGVEEHLRTIAPDTVYHLAAVHFIPTCERKPTLAVDVNVTGTQAVLEACARVSSVDAVVVASSGAVYAPASTAHAESDPLGPTDIYGFTKLWTEMLAEYFRRSTGTAVGIARIFNVIGPGETNPHLLPAIIEQIREGAELRLGNLSTKRDYVFSGDVGEGLALLGERCRDRGMLTCNLGSESAVSGIDLVELVARLAGRETTVETDPERVRASDRPSLASDCTHARETLEWHASTSLEDAVAEAMAQPFATGYRGE
jgi:UDP-glucose 4-epimerase